MHRLSIDPKKLTKGKLIGQGGFGTVYRGTYAKAPESAPLQVRLWNTATFDTCALLAVCTWQRHLTVPIPRAYHCRQKTIPAATAYF